MVPTIRLFEATQPQRAHDARRGVDRVWPLSAGRPAAQQSSHTLGNAGSIPARSVTSQIKGVENARDSPADPRTQGSVLVFSFHVSKE